MEKITLQNKKLNLAVKRFASISTLIICISFPPQFVFAQQKPNGLKAHDRANDSLTGITIHQEIDFKASPQRLYEVLLSSNEFSQCTKMSFPGFTAMSAIIDSAPGGTFTVFDGHIFGRILELVPGQRIVEAWRVVDWPAGIYSIAKFEFKRKGSGAQLIFDHVGFPEGLKKHLSIGWQQHYWDALTKYLQ